MMMKDQIILSARGITKTFPGVVALNNIDFDLLRSSIHAIVGQNGAGKSTFCKILGGIYRADSGKIFVRGVEADIKSPADARRYGITLVHQEVMLVPNLSIAENIFINKIPYTLKIDKGELYDEAKKYLEIIGLRKDPRIRVNELRVVEQQMVQLARALAEGSSIICVDELTSALSPLETKNLFAVIDDLRKHHDKSFIFITHRVNEVFELADYVSAFREGVRVLTKRTSETTPEEVIRAMIGRDIREIYVSREHRIIKDEKPVLKVDKLTTKRSSPTETELRDVSFELYRGEILAIVGLLGAGKTELGKALIGEGKIVSGHILVKGREVKIKNPHQALRHGIFYLPESRKTGIIPDLRIYENINLSSVLNKALLKIFRRKSVEKNRALDWVDKIRIHPSNIEFKVKNLSGGNQQKVLIARALEANADILILDEPTFGVDIGAKAEIRRLISTLADRGYAILLLTSDIDEALSLADRIAIMSNGRIIKILENINLSREMIISSLGGKE